MYVAAACHLFVQSSVHVFLFLWPGLDPSRRHWATSVLHWRSARICAHIHQGVVMRLSFIEGLSFYWVLSWHGCWAQRIICCFKSLDHSVCFIVVLSCPPCFIRSFSNQVKFYDSSNMFHTFPCYTLFLISYLETLCLMLALPPVGFDAVGFTAPSC